tara:strand:- start:2037 stop:2825 length:789 start_codon:yes stop_codon:yes gene_type:complete
MLISHEVPKSLFNQSLEFNDYDYALVHLFDKDPEYLKFYKDSVKNGRHVLLDNSIFELGEAYDNESFAKWVEELKPAEYIVPDALENIEKTIQQMEDWNRTYRKLPGKKIGVVQGTTPEELVECYIYLDKQADCDKIAFSFDYSIYEKLVPHKNKYMCWMLGRALVLANMLDTGVINTNKPHHLLGCGLPQEFALYRDYKWIESIDTSNPIVHGIKGIKYEYGGLQNKESIKLVDLLDVDITTEQLYDINHNINYFRNYVNG